MYHAGLIFCLDPSLALALALALALGLRNISMAPLDIGPTGMQYQTTTTMCKNVT
jgi:hypothetical protein